MKTKNKSNSKAKNDQPLKAHRFVGISLGGGKTDKTCTTVLEFYPEAKKVFLKEINEKVRGQIGRSSDLELHKYIENIPPPVEHLAFDVPLQMPKCLRCRLKCPGYEVCQEPEIKWLRKYYTQHGAKKKFYKSFTPYTERCVENYLRTELEESFQLPHALGANAAPLTARAHFIVRRLKMSCIEVYPKLSLWRIGRSLGIQKSYLRFHKHAVEGEDIREAILKQLLAKGLVFIYEEDIKTLISNSYAFDAFLCGLTAYYKFINRVEKRPKGFPESESWIEIPKID